MEKNFIKRAFCCSGGGARGSWAGGLAQRLIEQGHNWDMFFGTSTGSLIISLTSLKEMQRLKDAYTSISQKDIFSVDPFFKNGKINIFNALYRIIKGKTSLGEAGGLRKLISTMFTEQDYENTITQNKQLFVCVTNYTKGCVEFKSQLENSYSNYCDYTLASASVPIAFDLVKKNGYEYLDGGVMKHVPIQEAINRGADEIDAIILRPEKYEEEKYKCKNIYDVLMRTLDLLEREVSYSDVAVSQLAAKDKDVILNLYYTPTILTENSLVFNKEQMLEWWQQGYDFLNENNKVSYMLSKKGSINRISNNKI